MGAHTSLQNKLITRNSEGKQRCTTTAQQDFSLRRLRRRCRHRKWNENPLKSFSNFTSLSVCLSLSLHMPASLSQPSGTDFKVVWADRTRRRCCWTHKNVAPTCFVLFRSFFFSRLYYTFLFVIFLLFFCCLPDRNRWSNWLRWISCLGTREDSATRPRCHRLHSLADDSFPEHGDHNNHRPKKEKRRETHMLV